MIRIELSDPVVGPYYAAYSNERGTQYNKDGIVRRCFLNWMITPAASSDPVEEWEVGLPPIPDGTCRGRLRDKGVSHITASGTVSLATKNLTVGNSLLGLPLWSVTNPTTGIPETLECTPHSWGDRHEVSVTIPSYTYTISGQLRRASSSTITYWWEYLGDYGVVFSEYQSPSVTVVQTGAVLTQPAWRSTYTSWAFRTGLLVYGGYGTVQGRTYTAVEREAIVAACNFVSPLVLARTIAAYTSFGEPQEMVETLKQGINAQFKRQKLNLDFHPTDFGDLALECSSQVKPLDENVLLLALDVQDWRSYHTMWKTLTTSDSWKKALKAFQRISATGGKARDLRALFDPSSSTFLFAKYAVLPTVSDCKRLVEGGKRSSHFLAGQRLHSRREVSMDVPDTLSATHIATLTVDCGKYPDDFAGRARKLIAAAKGWGVFPELVNLWDILPGSFIADWFVSVGDLLKDADNYLYQDQYFPVRGCTGSEKWIVTRDISTILPGFPATGIVKFSYYVRWISSELPLPTVSLELESPTCKHTLESAALILQRIR